MRLSLTAILTFAALAANAAPDTLLKSLRTAYPEVARWDVQVLGGGDSVDGTVVKLGVRSAVEDSSGRLVWYAVAGYQPVLIAGERLGLGEPLAASSVQLAEQNIVGVACTPLTRIADVAGMRVVRSLPRGAVVCAESLESVPAVTRGSFVTVTAVARGIAVSSRAQALADGNVGDLLSVRNTTSKKRYLARVSGVNEVIVHEQ